MLILQRESSESESMERHTCTRPYSQFALERLLALADRLTINYYCCMKCGQSKANYISMPTARAVLYTGDVHQLSQASL